ncbi:HAD family hydrolase [Thermococcus paralvinellae]|uniref:Phosphoglycolate phosphatase n=1 Tax=Thermococcus paralvinellae TaxID=582419 RepID=W0I705_9EURY|nr:HAD family hydrolase [Thermococcus paralvinellae]AHF80193.1 phosphoglycolate phosphatase [Thermococcus paralvinellae]
MIRAVIFDVDETLIYYENYNAQEWFNSYLKPAFQRHSINVDFETYRKMVKGILPRSYVEKLGINHVEFWKLVDNVNLKYRRVLAKEGKIKIFPDVSQTLQELKTMRLKLAAVSNASQDCTEFVLELFDLRKYFEVIFGKDYSYLDGAKPNPYLIQKSLKVLNVSPSEALVVGDSELDVKAAHRAGIKAVQVLRFDNFVEEADYHVRDLNELVDLVKKLVNEERH